jgi:uncharacterized protein YdhG (YjbR/CyaY superfamily)
MTPRPKVTDVDSYISSFPTTTQKALKQMRATIKKAAPKAEETISYQIPAYKYNGQILVYFAGYDHHIGFYPTASGIENFKSEFANYKSSKGAVQFPIDAPLPLDLVTRIVQFRIKLNEEKVPKSFLSTLGAPAQRALKNNGITNVKQLAKFSEKDILKLHGIGPSSIPKLKNALKKEGLEFRK